MAEGLMLTDQHPISGRWAVLDDDGTSAWLYLTEPGSRRPAADVWVYNRVPAPEPSEIRQYRNGPPPAAQGYAGPLALRQTPQEAGVRFTWSAAGDAVAVYFDGELAAYIPAGQHRGHSRNLIQSGPWGEPIDPALLGRSASNEGV